MSAGLRVELQAEVERRRPLVYPLVASAGGLASWLDAADLPEPVRPGAPIRLRLHEALAEGTILAVDPPQHISFSWDYAESGLGYPTVVAFDVIDHGARTHLTLRHVGFRSEYQRERHELIWRYWFDRLVAAAASLPAGSAAGVMS